MSVLETIMQRVGMLPLSKQVEVANYVHQLSTQAHEERADMLRRTHGALDEADGEVFEQAMLDARRMD